MTKLQRVCVEREREMLKCKILLTIEETDNLHPKVINSLYWRKTRSHQSHYHYDRNRYVYMIVKAENHLLHRPMNNFAVPQTYGGLNFLQSLLHAWDKCTVSLLLLFIFSILDKHVFNWKKNPQTNCKPGNEWGQSWTWWKLLGKHARHWERAEWRSIIEWINSHGSQFKHYSNGRSGQSITFGVFSPECGLR